jgi:hypothetical protein
MTVGLAKNLLVWIVFLTIPIAYYDKDKQEWGYKRYETFSWLQLAGFILLVFGVLVFNEIIVIPFWRFNENTKKAIAEREEEEA